MATHPLLHPPIRQSIKGVTGIVEPFKATQLVRLTHAASMLSVSLNHVRNLIESGQLTTVKVGQRSRRIPMADIERFAKQGYSSLTPKEGQKNEL